MMVARRFARFAGCLPAGRVRAGMVAPVLLAALAIPALFAHAESALLTAAPSQPQVDTKRVSVEIDRKKNKAVRFDASAKKLYFAGMPAEIRPGRSGGGTVTLTVAVDQADSATLDWLRSFSGVRSARRVCVLPGSNDPVLQSDRVVVRPRAGVSLAQIDALLQSHNCERVRTMGIGIKMHVVKVPDDAMSDSISIAQSLAASGLFEFAEPDFYIPKKLQQVADPLFLHQWHLENVGQNGGLPGADVRARDAWAITQGSGATVAILDDAIQIGHEDLAANVAAAYDFVHDDADPSPERPGWIYYCLDNCDAEPNPEDPPVQPWCALDPCEVYDCWGRDSHGTATAGLAAGRANNRGIRGVAPLANLVPIAMLDASDSGVADAFYFADEIGGAEVISNSWSYTAPGYPGPLIVRAAIEDVATNGRGGLGCLVMFSSGNDAGPIHVYHTLAAQPYNMAIGATLKDDRLTCYSNFGEEQSVVAPGGGSSSDYSLTGLDRCGEADIVTTDLQPISITPGEEEPPPPDPIDGITIDFLGLCETSPIPPEPITGYNPPPQRDILIPDYFYWNLDNPSYSQRFNGTSAACPVAAGVATLVFSVAPGLTAEQARNILEHTADRITPEGAGYDPVTGHNIQYGHGRVNAFRAVQAAQAGQLWPSPVRNVQNNSIVNNTFLQWTNPAAGVTGVLIVRSVGPLNFTPVDGQTYNVGDEVAPNTHVVLSSLATQFIDPATPDGEINYGIFTYNNARFYGWGRRTSFVSQAVKNAPLAAVSASPSAGYAPLTVLFSGAGIDPQKRPIVAYNWTFGDGNSGSGASVEHTYASAGQYYATLTVQNSLGLTGSSTILVTVLPSGTTTLSALIASLQVNPASGAPSLPVVLSAGVKNAANAIARYEWTFGDGSGTVVTTGPTTTHTYASTGSYVASVRVVDAKGLSSTASASVLVTNEDSGAERTNVALAPVFCGAGVASSSLAALLALGVLKFAGRRRR